MSVERLLSMDWVAEQSSAENVRKEGTLQISANMYMVRVT